MMGVPNIGLLNTRVLAGEASDLIKVAEAFHEKKLASIADAIYAANRSRGARLVLISGHFVQRQDHVRQTARHPDEGYWGSTRC